ncbi:hypothetical protein KSS87_020778 [Heliosperma pusillum]|nr:hypothetical protein KSS87_020778 [Heliosperma pusillum]
MAATIFEEDIAFYKDVFHEGHEYEIPNPTIKIIPEQFRIDNHLYQMYLRRAISISSLRTITSRTTGENQDARDIVIVDQAMQPVVVTAWRGLALESIEKIARIIESLPLIQITRVKASGYGDSLATPRCPLEVNLKIILNDLLKQLHLPPAKFGIHAVTEDELKAYVRICGISSSMEAAPKKDSKAPPPSSKPAKSGGGKQKKKKWSKGKQKEKVNNLVLFDNATFDKLVSEAGKQKVITAATLSERFRINGSLARRAIRELLIRGIIKMVAHHSSLQIYTRATNEKVQPVAAA